jgi:hypothetical protein
MPSEAETAAILTPSPKISLSSTMMTDMDADTKFDPLGLRRRRILLNHAALHLDGASGCIEDAGELDQHAIAARFNDPPGGIEQGPSSGLEVSQCALLRRH